MSKYKCTACEWTGEKEDIIQFQADPVKADDWLDKCPDCGSLESMEEVDEQKDAFRKHYKEFGGDPHNEESIHIAYMCFLAGYTTHQDIEIADLKARLQKVEK